MYKFNNKKKEVYLYFVFVFLSSILAITAQITSNVVLFLFACLLFQINSVGYSLLIKKSDFLYVAYHAMFFLFLLGRYFVVIIFKYTENYSGLYDSGFNRYTLVQIFNICYMSLVSVELAYRSFNVINDRFVRSLKKSNLLEKVLLEINKSSRKLQSKSRNWHLKNKNIILIICLSGVIIAAVAKLHYYFAFADYAQSVGYSESYLSTVPNYPTVLYLIGRSFEVFFFILLILRLRLWFFGIISLFYLMVATGELASGRRMQLMQSAIIIFVFFFIIYWKLLSVKMKRSILISIVIIIPLLVVGLQLVSYARYRSTSANSLIDTAMKFFYDQGVSTRVIGNVIKYKNDLPEGRYYSLGPIMDMVDTLLGKTVPIRSSVDSALNGRVLSDALSYLQNPEDYLKGISLGSSHVAELYIDWGIIGVVIGSFIFGYFYRLIETVVTHSQTVKAALAILVARELIIAPRSQYLKFIFGISPTNLTLMAVILLMVIGISKLVEQQNNKYLDIGRNLFLQK